MAVLSEPDSRATPEEKFEQRLALVEQSIDLHGQYIMHYLHSLTRQWQDAEDIYTKLWIKVLHSFPESKVMHVGVLRKKAYQLFVDFWRKKRKVAVVGLEEVPEAARMAPPPDAYTDGEERALRQRFFEEYDIDLTAEQREAVWLYARYGYTHKEIAQQLGRPPSTIGDWITRARTVFADHLSLTA